MAWELCSKRDVMSIHPVNDSDLEDQWSDEIEGLIRKYKRSPNLGRTETITDEIHNGDGTPVLHVKKPPISSITSLSVNDVLLTASDYVVFENYIILKAQSFPKGLVNIKVSYVSGTSVVDADIKLTAAAMIIAIYNYKRRMGSDASLKWGSPDNKVGEETPNVNVGLTSHLRQIMRRMLQKDRILAR
jgi:hypothetical protein